MREERKIDIRIALMFLSCLSILFILLLDYNSGTRMYELGNPLVEDEWGLTILNIIVFLICVSQFVLQMRKSYWIENSSSSMKKYRMYKFLVFFFVFTLIYSVLDLMLRPNFIFGSITDNILYRDDNIILMMISVLSIILYKEEIRKHGIKQKNDKN